MSRREELIANALRRRSEEVSARIAQLSSPQFGERESFVSDLRRSFAEGSFGHGLSSTPATWVISNSDCLSALSALALGIPLEFETDSYRALQSYVESLHEARRDPDQAFRLLSERYACPLNFAFPAESPVREYLLTRLMVQWRAKLERDSIASVESNALLLQLNLVAVNAALNRDLRFVDALNYYYELLPTDRQPNLQNNWLLVSYFALYARALTAWLSRI